MFLEELEFLDSLCERFVVSLTSIQFLARYRSLEYSTQSLFCYRILVKPDA